ncbi:PTS sugar transporter subunit IIB [Lacticaseibacillus pantheris]|uniref:PTS EIIB type-3 domain-containing protein n=1 Tax=Lacticaseibacillus pantheris DSM 15945 = JCM 12539 = NBRC 106106 TaxID=1423783 RepID=A0A0R1U0V2_9LACO|nr:hypothetical protein [Lacticaseibacillus pantheris]KRL86967.1 hypothetical protein FC50_GL000167 [Lacticaseibacillus pantheris DSM 15945 = JCM 12539 = NBRC 106106]
MVQKLILLVCSAGMSTSLLVSRMTDAASDAGVDAQVVAIGSADVNAELATVTPAVIMVAPQVSYLATQLRAKLDVPVAVMDTHDYATLAGPRLLQSALDAIQRASAHA